MHWRILLLILPAMLLASMPSRALIVNGEEVEDIYAYILEVLEEQQRAEEAYQVKVQQGVEYRGNKPYGFNALRHLSMDDLVYGAVQGGLTAVREMGPNATPQQVEARAEANIQRVMQMFPMLANNFMAGELLLKRLKGTDRKDYMQLFLLRRARPGLAGDSIFSLFWRDELLRNRNLFIDTLGELLDSINTEAEAVRIALPLYVDVVEETWLQEFEKDAGARRLMDAQPELTPQTVFADPALMAQLENPGAFHNNTEALAAMRDRVAAQAEPAMQREADVVEMANKLLAQFDERHPLVKTIEVKPRTPQPITPEEFEGDIDEGESKPAAPGVTDVGEDISAPKLGIPTLGGLE